MRSPRDSLQMFVDRMDRPAVPPRADGVVVFAAGKGGLGVSTVVSLLALRASLYRRVLVVDAQSGPGTLHLLLGVDDAGPGILGLEGGALAPAEIVRPVRNGLSLVPGLLGPDAFGPPTAERRALFRRLTSLYAAADLVLIDAGATAEGVTRALAGGGQLVAVTAPGTVAAATTYALIKWLERWSSGTAASVLVNRADGGEAQAVFDAVRSASARFLDRMPAGAGALPAVAGLSHTALADLMEMEPGESPLTDAVDGVLEDLLRGNLAQRARIVSQA